MAYTTIDNPELYFQTKTYSGNATDDTTITLDGSKNMQPDWVWIKNRDTTHDHYLANSVIGSTKYLSSNTTTTETTLASGVKSFTSNGFVLGTNNTVNKSGSNLVAWNWKAGTSFTNDASATGVGTIDSTGSINTTAGFSIISYTGTGSAGSIAHGLGVKPDWILSKDRTSSGDWNVYHDSFAAQERIKLNSTGAKNTNTSIYASLPTSSVVNVGTGGNINTSGNSHIFYCFAEKKGYSKFGIYTGNGNADGPFVYTGFRPAWILLKNYGASGDSWQLHDNKRLGYNVDNNILFPNTSGAESTADVIDILSNGFKIRITASGWNSSGVGYIYMAFAESPFVNSNGIPNNAR